MRVYILISDYDDSFVEAYGSIQQAKDYVLHVLNNQRGREEKELEPLTDLEERGSDWDIDKNGVVRRITLWQFNGYRSGYQICIRDVEKDSE